MCFRPHLLTPSPRTAHGYAINRGGEGEQDLGVGGSLAHPNPQEDPPLPPRDACETRMSGTAGGGARGCGWTITRCFSAACKTCAGTRHRTIGTRNLVLRHPRSTWGFQGVECLAGMLDAAGIPEAPLLPQDLARSAVGKQTGEAGPRHRSPTYRTTSGCTLPMQSRKTSRAPGSTPSSARTPFRYRSTCSR